MEHRQTVALSRLLASGDAWEDTAISWQQQVEAVFGRARRGRPAFARPAPPSQPSEETDRRPPRRPVRPRS